MRPDNPPPEKPVLGPYELTKGRTIPNEPITGPFPRPAERHWLDRITHRLGDLDARALELVIIAAVSFAAAFAIGVLIVVLA